MVMNKKAVSAIVGYVLLISITLALSVMVYNWLKFYVATEDVEACSDNVNVIINSYECYEGMINGRDGNLSVTLKNKGLFTVDGYTLKIHTRDDAEFGLYVINETGGKLNPGEVVTVDYNFVDYIGSSSDINPITGKGYDFIDKNAFHTVSLVEVQPFITDDNGNMTCQSFTTQRINCKNL